MNKLHAAVSEIMKSSDLQGITMDMVEKVLDSEFSSVVLKEFPVVKFLHAANQIYSSYSDRILIKQAMLVLLETSQVEPKERRKFLEELSDKDSSGAEKVLMAINKLDTSDKAKVFGRLCKLKILGRISVDDFFRLTKLIQDAYLLDLRLLLDFKVREGEEIYEGDYLPLITLGLIYRVSSEQKPVVYIPEREDRHGIYGPTVSGGEVRFNYYLSGLGSLMLSFYDELIMF